MLTQLDLVGLTGPSSKSSAAAPPIDKEAVKKAAQEFETAYIAQMLTFSGLDDALMAGGGEDVSAFTSFYIQNFAEKISENGGFGLAEKFYDHMIKISGASGDAPQEDVNVDFGKL